MAAQLAYLFCLSVVSNRCFCLSIVEVECVIVVEITLKKKSTKRTSAYVSRNKTSVSLVLVVRIMEEKTHTHTNKCKAPLVI